MGVKVLFVGLFIGVGFLWDFVYGNIVNVCVIYVVEIEVWI